MHNLYKDEDDKLLVTWEAKMYSKHFRENKRLENEIGYYVFDYRPEDELIVRQRRIDKLSFTDLPSEMKFGDEFLC